MPTFENYVEGQTAITIADADEFTLRDASASTVNKLTFTALKTALNAEYAPLAYARNGSGAPNGVVTGSIGDRYVDTAATLGARIWYKDSGVGNTGWLVEVGDTGWRDVSGLLRAGLAVSSAGSWGRARMRRINSDVLYEFKLNVSAGAIESILGANLPTGWTVDLPAGIGLTNAPGIPRQATSADNGFPSTVTNLGYLSAVSLQVVAAWPNPGTVEWSGRYLTPAVWQTVAYGA